jgi:hypothetical protein
MALRPVQGKIFQEFEFNLEHADGEIATTIRYLPGEVDQAAKEHPVLDEHGDPMHDSAGAPTMRPERIEEWLDRAAPGNFTDEQGNTISAAEFLKRYPDHRWLMREVEAAIHRNSNPFTRQRHLRSI